MINIVKRIVPEPAKAPLCRARRFLNGLVLRARLHHFGNYFRFLSYLIHPKPTIHFTAIHNVLPNSGLIPLVREFSSAKEIVANFPNAAKRSQVMDGFEGFAPDDAVFDEDTEIWELWSNVRLAGVIASFGYANYKNPSVLELGCGPAHLFFFLRHYGIRNYVGIDGNPYFIKFNRFLRGYEQHFLTLNLQQEIMLYEGTNPLKFDIVCSFDVLEHIREDMIDSFIKTFRNHMHARSVAFCTASLQTHMDVHVLVRDRDWWLQKFAKYGLYSRSDEAELVRKIGDNHPFNWNPSISNVFALEARD